MRDDNSLVAHLPDPAGQPVGWDMIPGARGCTPQACSFRDHFAELKAMGVDHLFGLSTQDSEYQREAAERLHLLFSILADEDLEPTRAMSYIKGYA
jgi:peroxiredoxin